MMGYKPQRGTHKMHSVSKRMNHQQQCQRASGGEHFLCVAATAAAAAVGAGLAALTLPAKKNKHLLYNFISVGA